MNTFTITFNDNRFAGTDLSASNCVALLHEMIKHGTLDLSDEHVSGLQIVETSNELEKKLLAMVPELTRG
ncbi:hypothetical protein H261_08248 [Paramagnetospirillum caucaseum]|uniref:Uncharacterized protein n=1 Tax=Paramagnetospirillum caucaseum TaxID=1244869 RepID=M3ACD3_9PROT|nr:hypothetical protein [Paramagnetospirillum caucaseum]EME70458.1 hypothetical protein H261_08248 [Paramagnetospirillum caucaseum]